MRIRGIAILTAMLATEPTSVVLAQDSLRLREVLVEAQRLDRAAQSYRLVSEVSAREMEAMPVHNVNDMLVYLPGIDVRTRGNNGSQADVGLRGGTFGQVRVMLNGVALSDAQTGHYSLNLPITASLIDRMDVLDGAINIVTKSKQTDKTGFYGRLTTGMNGLVNPEMSLSRDKGRWHINAAAEYNRSDGFYAPDPTEKEKTAAENSGYQIANLYVQARRQTSRSMLDIQGGAQYKDAGAGMFYGFGSQTQRDQTHMGFAAVSYRQHWGRWSLYTGAGYRVNADYYRWWADEPKKGANKHLHQTGTIHVAANYVSRIGTTTAGVELRDESIYSTNLGDSIAKPLKMGGWELALGKNRLNVRYYARQSFHHKRLNASVGIEGDYNTMFGSYGGGQANLGVLYAQNGQVYINASHTRRLPTYTDLYYHAGNQRGSRELRPESMTTLAIGTRYEHTMGPHTVGIEADAFYRMGRDIIDWVYVTTDSLYHATNQNKVNAAGCEVTARYSYGEWVPGIRAAYAYTWLDLDLNKTGSRYLDYLKHKVVVSLDHSFYVFRDKKGVKGRKGDAGAIGGSYMLSYRERMGQYNSAEGEICDFRPVLLLDVGLYWQNRLVRVAAECTNVTNRHYYDYGGILQLGAWAKVSVGVRI